MTPGREETGRNGEEEEVAEEGEEEEVETVVEGNVQKKNPGHPAETGFLSFLRPFFVTYFSRLAPVNRSHPCAIDEIEFVLPIVLPPRVLLRNYFGEPNVSYGVLASVKNDHFRTFVCIFLNRDYSIVSFWFSMNNVYVFF